MERIVYLDNSATTKPCLKSCEYINTALKENWGNPSSLHTLGMNAEILVDTSREKIAKLLSCDKSEIFFTGSGTESNNTAIMSAVAKRNGLNKIITTKIEHPSVLKTAERLKDFGFEVVYLDCDNNGIVDLKQLENELNGKTALVSCMLVNNEIGSIEPIKEISKLIKEKSPYALLHCDAVQGFGKLPINPKAMGIDLLSASGHKIHGPKGIGILYCKKGVHIKPFITGGGQERGLRSGTESVPLIAGLMGAIEELPDLNRQLDIINDLNLYARELFINSGFIKINSPASALPYILNISVEGYRSETLLHFLEQRNIFVSSGSACAKGEASYVLTAVGIGKSRADSALRLSFSKENTKEDIDKTFEALKIAAKTLVHSKI